MVQDNFNKNPYKSISNKDSNINIPSNFRFVPTIPKEERLIIRPAPDPAQPILTAPKGGFSTPIRFVGSSSPVSDLSPKDFQKEQMRAQAQKFVDQGTTQRQPSFRLDPRPFLQSQNVLGLRQTEEIQTPTGVQRIVTQPSRLDQTRQLFETQPTTNIVVTPMTRTEQLEQRSKIEREQELQKITELFGKADKPITAFVEKLQDIKQKTSPFTQTTEEQKVRDDRFRRSGFGQFVTGFEQGIEDTVKKPISSLASIPLAVGYIDVVAPNIAQQFKTSPAKTTGEFLGSSLVFGAGAKGLSSLFKPTNVKIVISDGKLLRTDKAFRNKDLKVTRQLDSKPDSPLRFQDLLKDTIKEPRTKPKDFFRLDSVENLIQGVKKGRIRPNLTPESASKGVNVQVSGKDFVKNLIRSQAERKLGVDFVPDVKPSFNPKTGKFVSQQMRLMRALQLATSRSKITRAGIIRGIKKGFLDVDKKITRQKIESLIQPSGKKRVFKDLDSYFDNLKKGLKKTKKKKEKQDKFIEETLGYEILDKGIRPITKKRKMTKQEIENKFQNKFDIRIEPKPSTPKFVSTQAQSSPLLSNIIKQSRQVDKSTSFIPTKLKPMIKTKLQPQIKIKTSSKSKYSPLLGSISKLAQTQKMRQKQAQRQPQKQRQPRIQKQRIKPEPKIKTPLIIKPITTTKLQPTTRFKDLEKIILPRPKITRPKPPRPSIPTKRKKSIKKDDDNQKNVKKLLGKQKRVGYNAYIQEKGKYVKVNKKPLDKKSATSKVGYLLDNTASFKGKIKRAGKPAEASKNYFYNPFKFNKKGNKLIEKPSNRKDTVGERRGINWRRLVR